MTTDADRAASVRVRGCRHALGERGRVTHRLVRTSSDPPRRDGSVGSTNPRGYSYRTEKTWVAEPLPDSPDGGADVILVGVRTLSDGVRQWWGEDGWTYSPTRFFPALLVVSSLRSKPFLVPLEAYTATEEVSE